MVLTTQNIKDFKFAVKKTLDEGILQHGLCYHFDDYMYDDATAYDIMLTILTHIEYSKGLGPKGEFTEDRKNFCLFLLTLKVDDYKKFWRSYYKS